MTLTFRYCPRVFRSFRVILDVRRVAALSICRGTLALPSVSGIRARDIAASGLRRITEDSMNCPAEPRKPVSVLAG